ncbi:unnamed protein product [Rotaria sordida]|uniref:C2 domain-containing protein n=1 Tax=Rotaria sordida TaxID=392033 RepID=A0A814XMQ3_9BILA|nr:unnamed protein product [Rotaria sordida]CAF1218047.1 unnamed protein product [Rotaria sordida]CAF3478755.1 unnamed protein product [Rotaria sordida]CAF3534766.1 unnamed protein product [Rotaria sordida]
MSKLGSFFRRIFSSTSSDNQCPSPSLKSEFEDVPVNAPLSSSKSTKSNLTTKTTQSCSTSPRTVIKQQTINTDNRNESSNSNFLSSHVDKINMRRLSAPLIIHTSTRHHPQYSSTIVNESTEQALLSSLQRLSVSSSTTTTAGPNSSIHSLGINDGGSTSPLTRPDVRSVSFNLSLSPSSLSNNLVNNILPTSGTPPTQAIIGTQSSPRASITSNNSPSHSNAMKDISPVVETATGTNSDRKMSLPPRGRRPSMFDPIDPKELQQALYASAAAKSSMTINSTNEDDSNRAMSLVKISYDREGEHIFIDTLSFENMQILDAFVNNNHNINMALSSTTTASANTNHNDFISFYCRFRLWPEKRSLFQTKIVRYPRSQSSYLFDVKQLNDFELSFDQLNNHFIELLLYKVGTTKPSYKDIRIATVKYELGGLSEADQISLKKPLDESDPSSIIQDPDLGDLLVSLSYLQSAAKLAVVVLEAKNLRPLSIESKPFPEACVKVTLFDRNGKKLKRKKTSVQRASDCPTFNEELVFELRRDIAHEVMIELRIVHESLSYKEQLGSIIFGPTINNMMKASISPENIYWSTILSGESLNAQWQILKTPVRIEESK